MGNNINVRYLTKDDIKNIVEIEELCFPTPWTKGAFEKELKNKLARYIVIEKDTNIVAYGGIWLIIDEGHITNIAVHPNYRGLGFGNEIVSALINECIKNNIVSMTLEVRKSNIMAQNLYKKHGFKIAGIRPSYYTDTQEDALIMWKDINKGV
ncbi:ribosomal protein S18-alanine N-acetyltransferase [Tepidibacter formicigenes]|jgi:ribosomal-protein-alanine N-acetyltransferase|uniref:[Ribosomal protein bS18]-alanine N-acetyltransferase n=1 Tax=Tepidibacter formicigenes DSM 15518 TaxID=1123349 RepID=A0A1M6U0B4_9FIRM|nr:ribosomal protein S18-alanine N-acetyltransferase [Tepidibacter formicigenes]SHK62580.1 [SSU ribosomal protein S18P]-alanine acetyltransferase [Tepidibacter formicigenes DSM 15518]